MPAATDQKDLGPASTPEENPVESMAGAPVRLEILVVLHDRGVPGRATVESISAASALHEGSVLFHANVKIAQHYKGCPRALVRHCCQLPLALLGTPIARLQVHRSHVHELAVHFHAASHTRPPAPLPLKLHSQTVLRIQVHIAVLGFNVRRAHEGVRFRQAGKRSV